MKSGIGEEVTYLIVESQFTQSSTQKLTLAGLEKILGDTKYIGSVIEKQLAEFIENARSFRMSTEQILQRLRLATPLVHHFGNLGLAVLQRYERELASEDRIDFSDMLYRAADIVEKGAVELTVMDGCEVGASLHEGYAKETRQMVEFDLEHPRLANWTRQ